MKTTMEVEKPLSYESLFRDNHDFGIADLPVIKQCIQKSKNETEILRAVEIALCFSLKSIPVSELEEELFCYACPAAKNVLMKKLTSLEGNPSLTEAIETCIECLSICHKIVSYFHAVFEHLNGVEKISVTKVTNLLLSSSEILYSCFFHCKISKEIYGPLFSSLSEHLSNFFKKCCNLQEGLLNFLTDKFICETEIEEEWKTLNEVMTLLSKSGVVLINLEVKMMARTWKVYASLLERYSSGLKNNHDIGEIINNLCVNILNSIESVLFKEDQDNSKIIKLACFFLKLVIKFCEIFNGCLRNCQKSLLSVLLMLCRCEVSSERSSEQNLIKQLALGSDPLLSQLMMDQEFIKECGAVSKNIDFSSLCCLLLKKLIYCDSVTRNMWLNGNENILQWMFMGASYSQFITCFDIHLPSVVVEGKQRKFTDLYEYVLVTTASFLMTATSDEFLIIERTLMENVLQSNPVVALLAVDIWCLLARIAEPDLCFSQILNLSQLYQEFNEETLSMEKIHLASLIYRLIPLLTETQRGVFFKSFDLSFYSSVWSGLEGCSFIPTEANIISQAFWTQLDLLLDEDSSLHLDFDTKGNDRMFQALGKKLVRLWRFNCQVLSSYPQSAKFLRIACAMAACIASHMSAEDLFLIVDQVRKLLSIGQPTSIQLYFTRVLNSLSTVRVPTGSYQKKILIAIADVFRELLSSKQVIVKQKTLEIFYSFSHITTHSEIITLTVQNSPVLKSEITDYFKKKPPELTDSSLEEYVGRLYQLRFQHGCQKRQNEDGRSNVKRLRSDNGDLQEAIFRWKQEGEKIRECFLLLTESEKKEIKESCGAFLSLL